MGCSLEENAELYSECGDERERIEKEELEERGGDEEVEFFMPFK